MTVKITKPALNLREELNSLKKPAGLSALLEKIGAVSNRIQVSSDMTVAGTATFTDSIEMAYSGGLNTFNLLSNNTGFGTLNILSNAQTSGTDKYINIGRNTGSGQGMTTTITMGDDSSGSYTKVIGELQVTGSLLVPNKIEHTGDADTYLQFSGANDWRVVTGNVERFSVNDTAVVINEDSYDVDFRVESNGNANMLFVDAGNDHVNVGTAVAPQGGSLFQVRRNASCIEWGHGNSSAGFFGTLGAYGNNGHPYLGFSTEADTVNLNTFATYGAKGSIIKGDVSGNLIFAQVTDADATGQTPVEVAKISPSEFIVNDAGHDYDFRVETDTLSHAFFIDSSSNRAGVGTSTPNASLGIKKNVSNVSDANPVVRLQSATAGDELIIRAQGLDDSSVNRYADIAFLGSNTNEKIEFRAPYNTSSPQLILDSSNGVIMNEGGHSTRDFRVESDSNSHMLTVDAGSNCVRIGSSSAQTPATLEIKSANENAVSLRSNSSITGSSQTANYAEGVEAYDTSSLGTVLSIPITVQSNVWRQYIVEFMFTSAEYNASGASKSGSLKIGFVSLSNGAQNIIELDKTGNVASVSNSGTSLTITFTSGYTNGLNNYEGVVCYYKVLGLSPEYLQMWNGTLN